MPTKSGTKKTDNMATYKKKNNVTNFVHVSPIQTCFLCGWSTGCSCCGDIQNVVIAQPVSPYQPSRNCHQPHSCSVLRQGKHKPPALVLPCFVMLVVWGCSHISRSGSGSGSVQLRRGLADQVTHCCSLQDAQPAHD